MHRNAYTPERFWSRINKDGPVVEHQTGLGACWLWTGGVDKDGYGRCMYHYRHQYAHRMAYMLAKGEIPEGLRVLHRCDNPPCCNPDHLWIGTEAQNKADMVAKGRQATGDRVSTRKDPSVVRRGETNGHSKLTADLVLTIRAAHARGVPGNALADLYGMGQSQISNIVRRRQWKHLP